MPRRDAPPRIYGLYRGLSRLLRPLAGPYGRYRLRHGKEDAVRLDERRGIATKARPAGVLIWLHAASVGELVSVLPLVQALHARGHTLLVTTVTRTGADLAAKRLPPGVIHQYLPWDVPAFVTRFLDHWQPQIALFAESELWPNLLMMADERDIPLIQINARMSDRSFKRWRDHPRTISALLHCFQLSLAQSQDDAQRLAVLGAPRVVNCGNLKFDVPALDINPEDLSRFSALIGRRPVLLAASTHEGEEAEVLKAHRLLAQTHPDLLTIIAPRHPERAPKVIDEIRAARLLFRQRSAGQTPDRICAVYLADTLGELGLFITLAQVVFIGGSWGKVGGHNPIEPAKLGRPVLSGPNMTNFAEMVTAFRASNALLTVENSEALARMAGGLFADPARREAQAQAGRQVVERLTGAMQRTLAALEPFLMDVALRRGERR